MNVIPIAFITDNNYAVPTGTAIQSLIEHAKGGSILDIHVVMYQVDKEIQNLFLKFASNKVRVSIIEADESLLSFCRDPNSSYMTNTTYLKFYLHMFLPQYDKVLYLDGDILVSKDISCLFEIDLDGYYAAAVLDVTAMKTFGMHKNTQTMRYFNAGVLLMNLSKMRQEKLEIKLIDAAKSHPEFPCHDQDAFNYVFCDEVKYMEPKWNLMLSNLVSVSGLSINDINTAYNTDYRDMEALESDAAIIHLTNMYKPWKYEQAYMAEEWLDTFKRSLFKNTKIVRIRAKKSFFINDYLNNTSVLKLFGLPIVVKKKSHTTKEIKLFTFFSIKWVWLGFERLTYIQGLCIRRKISLTKLKEHVDSHFNRLITLVNSITKDDISRKDNL